MFKPLTNAVVIRPQPQAERIGLIFVPQTATPQSEILRGTVIMTGDGKERFAKNSKRRMLKSAERDPLEVKAGDEILYTPQYDETQVVDGERVHIVAEEFVIAVVG